MQCVLNDLLLKIIDFCFYLLETFQKKLSLLDISGNFQDKLLQTTISVNQSWSFQRDMKKLSIWRGDSIKLVVDLY